MQTKKRMLNIFLTMSIIGVLFQYSFSFFQPDYKFYNIEQKDYYMAIYGLSYSSKHWITLAKTLLIFIIAIMNFVIRTKLKRQYLVLKNIRILNNFSIVLCCLGLLLSLITLVFAIIGGVKNNITEITFFIFRSNIFGSLVGMCLIGYFFMYFLIYKDIITQASRRIPLKTDWKDTEL